MSRPWRKPRAVPDDDDQKYREFTGLVNTRSEKDVGLRGLTIANNVLGTDGKKIVTRPGYSLYRAGAPDTAYVLDDELYLVESGSLLRLLPDGTEHSIISGLTGGSYSWDAVNGEAYFVNGVDAGIVAGDNYMPLRVEVPRDLMVTANNAVLPATAFNMGADYTTALWRFCATYETADGRESAPSDLVEVSASPLASLFTATVTPRYARTNIYVTEPDGTVLRLGASSASASFSIAVKRASRELTTMGAFPLPAGAEMIQYWVGRMWASVYDANSNTSAIFPSRPFIFHLYDLGKEYIPVPGRVAMLLWNNKGLLIGTTQNVYQYTDDGKLDTLATYGVVPGTAGDVDAEGMAYFWTTRGFCKAMPFENLTEKEVSMAPGTVANTMLVYMDGTKQLITITQGGGTPFNARS